MTLHQLRDDEYVAAREAERLRRAVHEADDPASVGDDVLAKLLAADERLAEAASARAGEEAKAPDAGSIIDTTSKNRLLGGDTTKLEAKVTLRMSHVPTGIAHVLDPGRSPLLECFVKNTDTVKRRVRVRSFVEGYSAQAADSFEFAPRAEQTFRQLPTLFPGPVATLEEMTRATLNVIVDDLDTEKVELHRTVPVWLLPLTSAPLMVRDPVTAEDVDMSPYLGAWVTPNAAAVMSFLRDARKHHPDGTFAGYQGKPEEGEKTSTAQVAALFAALKESGVRYVNSVVTSSPRDGFFDQRIRLPRESLADASANCIDGTVLLASLLEAISMDAGIVIVPGHAFLAWATWSQNGEWRYLETTMIGTDDFEAASRQARRLAAAYRVESADPAPGAALLPVRRLRAQGITPLG